MTNIVLHIGAGKCGSSALQAALTANPIMTDRQGQTRTYAHIGKYGQVTSGHEIRPNKVNGYRSSVNFKELVDQPENVLAAARAALERIDRPIMSSEGLFCGPRHGQIVLGKLDLPVDVVAYVRPQVEYVNSAWWQWGAWADVSHQSWIEKRIRLSLFHNFLSQWAAIDQVKSVTVRLLPNDVVADFLDHLGVDSTDLRLSMRPNPSLPAAVLRLLQRNMHLYIRYPRQFDFVLPRLVSLSGLAKAPWVVDQALARQIVNLARPGNLQLLDMLDADSAATMRADARWWDAAAYADRVVEPFEPPAAESPETEKLAVALIEALLTRTAVA